MYGGLKAHIWLSLVLGACSGKYLKIAERFGSAENFYPLRETSGAAALLSPAEYARARKLSLSDADRILEYCEKTGVKVICYGDELYPERLRMTTMPPSVLYVEGDARALGGVCIAGVGSRFSTQYGRDAVRFLCEPLAASGVTLVSGLAAGIDTEVHRAALRAGGKTVAVLGTGIDVTYPKRHLEMRMEIVKNGAVISEYPPFASNAPYMFAVRNRIISGLSKAVIIFEAAKRSGTMITAGWALDDGREVFAVPGSILSDRSEGTNRLIKQGAIPALSAADVLETLGIESSGACARTETEAKDGGQVPKLGGLDKAVYDILFEGESDIDALTRLSGKSSGEVLCSLTMLELDGVVESLPGQRYRIMTRRA